MGERSGVLPPFEAVDLAAATDGAAMGGNPGDVRLIVERTRGTLWLLLGLMIVFLVHEVDVALEAPVYGLKVLHALLVVGALLFLRRTVGRSMATAVAFLSVTGSFVLIGLGDVLMDRGEAIPLVAAVCAMAAAALFPWGALAQTVCAVTLGTAALALLGGADVVDGSFPWIVLWAALAVSVHVAWELDRHRGVLRDAEVARTTSLARLEEVNRLKTEFVAMVSHELRTPLNVIEGYAEMLGDPQFSEPSLALAGIRSANRELLDLVSSTLDLERLESGPDLPLLRRVHLSLLRRDLAEELAPLAQRTGVDLRWPEPEDATFESDPRKLKTIIRHLVTNALKFTVVGQVAIGTRVEDDAFVLTVSDTGIGIPRDQLGRIFERFRQVEAPEHKGQGGVGLGLHIVRSLCAQLGGRIEVASEVGRGTTFTVTIPIDARRRG
jgi:signal transduction histidine kinase